MRTKRTIPFEISAMDSLGQGVSKLGDKVTFIPKTAPGDKGEATIMSEKKGVVFARVERLEHPSELRIEPQCIHFGSCPSCHFLHLSYDDELKFKKESFDRLFRKLPLPVASVIGAPQRFHYRNRIQLHYSLKSQLLGMRDPINHSIVPVPRCLIGEGPVLEELRKLYENQSWLKVAPRAAPEGHVEIYLKDGKVTVSWNRPYAEGGFTQVFELMNQKLKTLLRDEWELSGNRQILDLFGGNGNLSQILPHSGRLCVDLYEKTPGSDFFGQNLYDKNALRNTQHELEKRGLAPDNLLLDPPRSGLKDLSLWLENVKPARVAYVSCDPHTLARDLQSIKDYTIEKAFLIDFFPSTFHFETLMILERNL